MANFGQFFVEVEKCVSRRMQFESSGAIRQGEPP